MTPAELARIHAAAFAPERGWSEAEFQTLLTRKGARLTTHGAAFVLGQQILDEVEILTLATDPAAQRAGHGTQALAAFLAEAKAAGAARVFLEVAQDNAPARALYARAGFTEDGRRPSYYARKGSTAVDALLLSCRI